MKYKLKYLQLKNKLIGGTPDLNCVYCDSEWILDKKNPRMCLECYDNKITEGIEKLEYSMD